MSKPLIVEIPHELGLAEARRRIAEGLSGLDSTLKKAGISVDTMTWTEDRLDFGVVAMGQKVDGQVDVKPQSVRIEVRLPLLLSFFAHKLQKSIGNKGNLLLTKK